MVVFYTNAGIPPKGAGRGTKSKAQGATRDLALRVPPCALRVGWPRSSHPGEAQRGFRNALYGATTSMAPVNAARSLGPMR